MLASSPVVFSSLGSLAVCMAMVTAIIAVTIFRRISADQWTRMLIVAGASLLAIAAGQPTWNRSGKPSIVVMVDLSPSTRGATFRDRRALDSRVHQLLGDQPYEMLAFADGNRPMPDDSTLADLPAERTRFAPPTADAVVLLSDGQFELPAYAPPTYPLIDPALDHPDDAAVTELKIVGQQVMATVNGLNSPRALRWSGAVAENTPQNVKDFSQLATPTGRGAISAQISPGDRWPENDSLSIFPPAPVERQKWWVGDQPAPRGWTVFSPSAVPTDMPSLLEASVIVLNDVDAAALSFDQQLHLSQYVHDLGGALVIVGGPHAFAAGGYGNTALDELSPLASSPPEPAIRWMLLIDGSGSMAGDPWRTEADAITRLLPQLPTADTVSIGSFAETLTWWSGGKSAGVTTKLQLPPPNVGPHGPTNLAATLNGIARNSDGSIVTQLLLMTDADADLPNPAELAAVMTVKKIHLHLLAIGNGSALPALRSIAAATGGAVVQQLEPAQWITGASLLLRSAMPDHYQHRNIALRPAPPHFISEWNQTWLKPEASVLQKSAENPIVATWRRGVGQVTSIAYPAAQIDIEKLAGQIQQIPVDARFNVTWSAGAKLHVHIDAIDRDQFMNGLSLTLEMIDGNTPGSPPAILRIPQTGPGEYQLDLPCPRSPQLLSVRNGNQIVRRFAVAGRSAPEFEAIGNNVENLRQLADRSGGRVIPAGPVEHLKIAGSSSQNRLAPECLCCGILAMAAGTIQYRRPLRNRVKAQT